MTSAIKRKNTGRLNRTMKANPNAFPMNEKRNRLVGDLPKIGITGNSHFMFQEMNSDEIAANIESWLGEHGLN